MNVHNKTDSLDKILLKQGLISHSQLTSALQYQSRISISQSMSLAEVLVMMEYVTENQIKEALGEKQAEEDVLVQVLVREGAIQEDQLSDALKARDNSTQEKRLGTVLMELGHTNKEVIEEALKHYYLFYQDKQELIKASEANELKQKEEDNKYRLTPLEGMTNKPSTTSLDGNSNLDPIGQKLLQKGYINQQELQDAMDYQFRLPRILHKPLGEILVYLGYINQDILDELVQEQSGPPEDSLGQILVTAEIIQDWQLSHVLTLKYQAEHAHKKLGSLLIEMGYARRPQIEQALKSHFANNP